MGSDQRFGKGFFSGRRLPVSPRYVRAPGRARLYAIGGIALVLIVGLALSDAFLGTGSAIARGPLSQSHALFGSECATCHTPLEGVPDVKCESCHESARSATGTFSFERHYVYRSEEFDRSAPADREVSCAHCHREHEGRTASLVAVENAVCARCHGFRSFGADHPEFAFAAEGAFERPNLRFPHVLHVKQVLEEREVTGLEGSCLECHEPTADGRSFQPLSFERHCDACHLTQGTTTPPLPIAASGRVGVRTLQQIRAEADPATVWADSWNPNEFQERGGEVQKRPVYHADPWVMENLRRLRRELYPGARLAQLIAASADLPAGEPVATLHHEAIAALRGQVEALRGQPSRQVQRELDDLSELLTEAERRVNDPATPLDETRFDIGTADRSPALEAGELSAAAFGALIDSLTLECRSCHQVDRATIVRVQKDQRSIRNAEFDHSAHVIHASCLDCHDQIPIREFVEREEEPAPELDHAEILNLPASETCRSCHTSGRASVRCTSCHRFHPDAPNPLQSNRFVH